MRRAAVLALLAAGAFAVLPAPASSAAPLPLPHDVADVARQLEGSAGGGASHLPFEAALELPRRGGYEVGVFGVGRTVGVIIIRTGSVSLRSASYVVRGTVGRGLLKARFGNLGSISMRFHPAVGRRASRPRGCSGRSRLLHRRGVYVGRLRFRGEDGYISVDVRRAKGEVTEVDPRCAGGSRAGTSSTKAVVGPETSFFRAAWKHGVSAVDFLAVEDTHGADLLVRTETTRGQMAIVRGALLSSKHAVVKADDALTSGRVSGPAPFHGAGIYAAAPDGTRTWKGKLTVNLLGEPHLVLTGTMFDELELGRGSALALLYLFLENL